MQSPSVCRYVNNYAGHHTLTNSQAGARLPESGGAQPKPLGFFEERLDRFQLLHLGLLALAAQDHDAIGQSLCVRGPALIGFFQLLKRCALHSAMTQRTARTNRMLLASCALSAESSGFFDNKGRSRLPKTVIRTSVVSPTACYIFMYATF